MAGSPYFSAAYFSPTYFDTGPVSTGGGHRVGRVRLVEKPEPQVLEDEDDLVMVRLI
jgi:hypothetical protein